LVWPLAVKPKHRRPKPLKLLLQLPPPPLQLQLQLLPPLHQLTPLLLRLLLLRLLRLLLLRLLLLRLLPQSQLKRQRSNRSKAAIENASHLTGVFFRLPHVERLITDCV
jgi:hypothetical protein